MDSFHPIGSPDCKTSFFNVLGDSKAQNFVRQPLTQSSNSNNGQNNLLELSQTLTQPDDSVMCLVTTDPYLFAGSQSGVIRVWSNQTFLPVASLTGHSRSVLCMCLSSDNRLLFSGSGDDSVRVWDAVTLKLLYVIRTSPDVGDILSLAYCHKSKTLFLGCQDTSIQWFCLDNATEVKDNSSNLTKLLTKPNHTLDDQAYRDVPGLMPQKKFFPAFQNPEGLHYNLPETNVKRSAHHGYVYSLLIGSMPDDDEHLYLFSGSGDGNIKVWCIESNQTLTLISELKGSDIATVYCLVLRDGLLYAGLQGGNIAVWDLETFQRIRTLMAHKDDVMAMTLRDHDVYSACGEGHIKKWNRNFECIGSTLGHIGIVLCLSLMNPNSLVSGGSDNSIKVWRFIDIMSPMPTFLQPKTSPIIGSGDIEDLLSVLEKWVQIPTISGHPFHQEDCRLGAKLLKNLMIQLGGEARLVMGAEGRNPLVFATFKAPPVKDVKNPHVLFYGHYDVVSARPKEWDTDPFCLTGKDGYLYGRGVTDNKGPILAAVFAASELVRQKRLTTDITFLIEGEEESGSVGFYNAVSKLKPFIGHVDSILLSNSYWLSESTPCITYGLRGVIHASIKVSNAQPDKHSGVYGGAVIEPLIDLTHLLAKLISVDKKVLIPEFYEDVRPISNKENLEYENLVKYFKSKGHTQPISASKLQAQWRNPTFTVHKIVSSGPSDHLSVIPSWARAEVSMRIVPDQSIEKIVEIFQSYTEQLFKDMGSDNTLEVYIRQTADWWLGDPSSDNYKLLLNIIEKEWSAPTVAIREGGTIPAVPYLEKQFQCKALHLPMGQASDQAHLCNERIRLDNLIKGKHIVKQFFEKVMKSN